MLENSLSPLITDFRIEYDENMVESITPHPKDIPYLLKNEIAQFYIHFKGRLTHPFAVSLSYRDHLGIEQKQNVTLDPYFTECKGIEALSAQRTIQALQDTLNYSNESQ